MGGFARNFYQVYICCAVLNSSVSFGYVRFFIIFKNQKIHSHKGIIVGQKSEEADRLWISKTDKEHCT